MSFAASQSGVLVVSMMTFYAMVPRLSREKAMMNEKKVKYTTQNAHSP